jgi:hypothetical protein
LDFQKRNNLKNMNILFKVFDILHCSCFPISDFHEKAIQLIKNYKWRINNKKKVLKSFRNYCYPILKTTFNSPLMNAPKNNFSPNYEIMFKPVVETNYFLI